jgi:hypothetical protein
MLERDISTSWGLDLISMRSVAVSKKVWEGLFFSLG